MSNELADLLNRINPSTDDRLIFIGDLVDKGPDDIGVIRQVSALKDRFDIETILLRGNHEDKHLRFRDHHAKGAHIASEMARKSPELAAFMADAGDEDWQVLDDALPFWRCEHHGILAVHGGIPGNLSRFPDTPEEFHAATDKYAKHLKQIWRTRFIHRDGGHFLALDAYGPNDPFWAEVYDGRFGHVIFGHEAFMTGVSHFPHATGIDTGAVYGGQMTALVLSPEGERSFLAVDCPKFAKHRFE